MFEPFPEIPREVWDELKRMQEINNAITGAFLDMFRSRSLAERRSGPNGDNGGSIPPGNPIDS